ncbi:nagb/rpia/CoA transferase-like protein [Tothia fuscella]|uniref:5-formyltetrahydrofolate cyclo-ligase n=1 Tax=Tothia fuscella TaxID=1048955 RepID=A0A9P4U0E6_9PEZI|nr:nagb/rpia/CoA transferase-like protein [Tothia fuscella]
MMAALSAAKKELRKHFKKVLKEISNENVKTQSAAIAKTLFTLPEYQNAKLISVYLSMPTAEVQTAEIVRNALNNGKRVFIPYYYKLKNPKRSQQSSTMDMLELESIQDYEGFEQDKWGIPTPSEDSIGKRLNCFGGLGKAEGEVGLVDGDEDVCLDLIVTPGLGFDRGLGRIGRGMGFYDNFFTRCSMHSEVRKKRVPFTVGLALNEQVLPSGQSVPMAGTDQKLQMLILGDGSVVR